MNKKSWNILRTLLLLFFGILFVSLNTNAQEEVIEFDSDHWTLLGAQVVDYLGQKSLKGTAILKDVVFESGIIEVDIAVDGTRCFAAIVFGLKSQTNYEQFYLRPHKSKFPDALQYTPVFNGLSSWQLYSGEGFTAPMEIPYNRWIHIKMEISGTQARVYLDNADKPSLVISELKHGLSKGSLALKAPNTGQVHFANFKYKIDTTLKFEAPPKVETPIGMITKWQLSQALKVSHINREHSITEQTLPEIKWQEVSSEPSGLVDIARYVTRAGTELECVLARAVIHSEKDQIKKLIFGYSDEVSIFLNGNTLFRGNSEFRKRDQQFQGIIGLNDAVFLNLNKGDNELLLMVSESFGGWGFMCQLDDVRGDSVVLHEGVKKLWESPQQFITPESVIYDASRDILYLSNFNRFFPINKQGTEFISKVKLNGEIENLKWITGLNAPAGLAMFKDKLYVAERGNLVEMDIESGQIVKKYPVPDSQFLNDVAIDSSGNIYISDSRKSVIYKFYNGEFEEWLKSEEIGQPNGLFVDKDKLILGNSGDGSLKAINLTDKKISTIAALGIGSNMDGVRGDGEGNYIISDWNGRVFLITQSGQKRELINSTEARLNLADLEFIPEKNLIIIPTFYGNRLIAFQIDKEGIK